MSPFIIPVVLFLTTGFVLTIYLYYRSREKQMIIERGLTSDQIKYLYFRETKSYGMLKTGIVVTVFGIALGLGFWMESSTGEEEWMPFLIITGIGIGFIIAYFVGKKMAIADKANEKNFEEPVE